MKVLITGVCGFVGSVLAESLMAARAGISVCGIDNLMRPGSELNRLRLRRLGVEFVHGDIRVTSDVDALPDADWVVDAAANPSVLAGVGRGGSSRQLIEHNLSSLTNVLEYCRARKAGLFLLSTSRVYSIPALASLKLTDNGEAYALDPNQPFAPGISVEGVGPEFTTQAPISLYGSTKLAAEPIALEYGEAFDFPVWINRCGVMAGPGQFGTPDQGIFSFWVNAHLRRRPLKFIGFDGMGKQVRDALHPADLATLLLAQIDSGRRGGQRIYTAGGGVSNSMSLRQLHTWCDERFGPHMVASDVRPRQYDIPWMVMDNAQVSRDFSWRPAVSMEQMLGQIAGHAQQNADWLERSGL